MKISRWILIQSIALEVVILAASAPILRAQEVSPSPTATAQAEAVKKYPPLGVAGSPFHREFMARVRKARAESPAVFEDPALPLALADKVARTLPAVAAQTPSSLTDWYSGYTAETFGKLPAAQTKLDREAIDDALLSAAIFHATNAARRANRLRPFAHLPALRAAALEHSREMSALGFFSHNNPRNPAKATPSQRLQAQGIRNMAMGENISSLGAKGYTYWGYARAVVAQWMKSPGHRANILRGNYTHLGCGAHPCRCPNFHLLATQNFALPTP